MGCRHIGRGGGGREANPGKRVALVHTQQIAEPHDAACPT
jgi:hypothetical protein